MRHSCGLTASCAAGRMELVLSPEAAQMHRSEHRKTFHCLHPCLPVCAGVTSVVSKFLLKTRIHVLKFVLSVDTELVKDPVISEL